MTAVSWIIVIVGIGLWVHGYYLAGGASLIDWADFSPAWIAAMMPNWIAELGLAMSTLGSIPLCYRQLSQTHGR